MCHVSKCADSSQHTQAERAPVVDCVVEAVPDARGRGAARRGADVVVSAELVWVQRDDRARGVWWWGEKHPWLYA